MSNRSRNWLVTVNHLPDGVNDGVLRRLQDIGCYVRYAIFGREVAPTTNHVHLQGFLMFSESKSFNQVKALCAPLGSPDLRPGDGKAVAMMDYCKKDGDVVFEFGIPPCTAAEKGRRGGTSKGVNYGKITDLAAEGRLSEIRARYPKQFLQYYRTLQSIYKDQGGTPDHLPDVCGVWIYGPSGAGKSYYARERFGPSIYDKPCNKWWDNYKGEETVLIDDFDPVHSVLSHHLKRWADRYSFSGEIKGSQINLRPKKIVITSQYRISDIWEDMAIVDALNRRFSKIKIHMDSQNNRVIHEQGFYGL